MKSLVHLVRVINFRHLRERRLRTFLTVSGVAAGVALIVSIAVINSTLLSSARASIKNLAGAAEIEVATTDQSGLPQSILSDVRGVEGIDEAVPVTRTMARLFVRNADSQALVMGITRNFTSLFPEGLGEIGRVDFRGGFSARGNGLALSGQVAERIGASVGDRVSVETPTGRKSVEITGLISGPGVQLLNGGDLGAMLLPAAQRLFDKQARIDSIYVVLDPDTAVADVDRALEHRLEGAAIVGPPGERGASFEATIESIGVLTSLAGIVALFVAMFVVYNTSSMALVERRREISMALAMGAKRRQVSQAFLLEAGLLGAVASMVGCGAGVGLARLLVSRAVDQFAVVGIQTKGPLAVSPGHLIVGVLCGILISVLGAFLPARRITRVVPIEALRPEARHEWARLQSRRMNPAVAFGIGIAGMIGSFAGILLYAQTGTYLVSAIALTSGLSGITFVLPYLVPIGVRALKPVLARIFGTTGRLAVDGLQKNPGRTSVTVGALTITLGLFIGVGGALGSFDAQFRRFADQWYTTPLLVQASSYQGGVTSDQLIAGEYKETLEGADGVKHVFPFRYASLIVNGEPTVSYVTPVRGPARPHVLAGLSNGIDDPQPLAEALARGELVIARHMAARRDLALGRMVEVATPDGARRFRIGGIFNDLASFDSMYLDYKTYRRHWRMNHVDAFGIETEPGVPIAVVERSLERAVRANDIPAQVLRKEEQIESVAANVSQLFSIAEGIQLAALIVAFLTIVNTMFTAVLERKWEFGLQRALGMGRTLLGRTVLLEAVGIGVLGGAGALVLGTGLGFLMLLGMNLTFTFEIPYQIPWDLFAVSIVAGTAIAAISGLYPRRLAVRVPIVECLRYE